MKITANFATYSKRKHIVNRAIDSIKNQVDIVRVYYNDYHPDVCHDFEQIIGPDQTDRSKFHGIQENEIAFTCDDDIIFPDDYVDKTIEKLQQYGGIVSWHGRILQGEGLRYYFDHETFHFRWQKYQQDCRIDVPGTGVMAFYSNDFNPNMQNYTHDRMVDLLIGLEAAKQKIPITCIRNKNNWINAIRTKETIYDYFRDESVVQNRLANIIYRINKK